MFDCLCRLLLLHRLHWVRRFRALGLVCPVSPVLAVLPIDTCGNGGWLPLSGFATPAGQGVGAPESAISASAPARSQRPASSSASLAAGASRPTASVRAITASAPRTRTQGVRNAVEVLLGELAGEGAEHLPDQDVASPRHRVESAGHQRRRIDGTTVPGRSARPVGKGADRRSPQSCDCGLRPRVAPVVRARPPWSVRGTRRRSSWNAAPCMRLPPEVLGGGEVAVRGRHRDERAVGRFRHGGGFALPEEIGRCLQEGGAGPGLLVGPRASLESRVLR